MENEKKSNAYRLAYSLPPLYSPDLWKNLNKERNASL